MKQINLSITISISKKMLKKLDRLAERDYLDKKLLELGVEE